MSTVSFDQFMKMSGATNPSQIKSVGVNVPPPQPVQKPSMMGNIKDIMNKREQAGKDIQSQDFGGNTAFNAVSKLARHTANFAGEVGEVGMEVGSQVVDKIPFANDFGRGAGVIASKIPGLIPEFESTKRLQESMKNSPSMQETDAKIDEFMQRPNIQEGLGAGIDLVTGIATVVGAAEVPGVVAGVTKVARNKIKDAAGTAFSGVSEKLAERSAQKSAQNKFKAAIAPEVTEKVSRDPRFGSFVQEAQKQGLKDKDINLLSSIKDGDKEDMQEMFNRTVKAQSDPRQTARAADKLGETVTSQVDQVAKMNKQQGRMVDQAAKGLKGQPVDVTDLQDHVVKTLDDADIFIDPDTGDLDFSGSLFQHTPEIQKELQKVIRAIPDGSDAYQLHIFKKSVDNLLDYTKRTGGLSGKADNLLGSLRASADDLLDNNFPDYNAANTSFKFSKDFLTKAESVAGKSVDFSTVRGQQAFGQALRSAFSNNKSRGATLDFISELQKTAEALDLVGADKNVLDQALFVNLLEETFGSEAATGLASEVAKGVNAAKTGLSIMRNPIEGSLNAAADLVEKARNITPEAKKKIIQDMLQYN